MHSALGQWLGWLMAAIYTGGRLPQIWLNVCAHFSFLFPNLLIAFYFLCQIITDKVVYIIIGQIKRGSVEVIFDLNNSLYLNY